MQGEFVKNTGKYLGAATLSHEITHFLQDYAPEEYNELKDFITSEILISDSYRMLLTAAAARESGSAMLAAYRPGQDLVSFVRARDLADQVYGKLTNITFAQARKAFNLRTLSDVQLQAALEQGRKTAPKTSTKITKQEVSGTLSFWEGGKLEGVEYDATSEAEARKLLGDDEVDFVKNVLSKVADVTLVKSKADAEGNFTGAQGIFYEDGRIYLDVNAGLNSADVGQRTIILTAAHEMTHYIRRNNEAAYAALRDFVVAELTAKGQNIEDLMLEKQARSAEALSDEEALEEVIADSCEMMFTDVSKVQAFASAHEAEARTIWKWLNKFLSNMKERFSGLTAAHREAAAMMDKIDEMRRIWFKALGEIQTGEATVETAKQEGGVFAKYSTRTEALAHEGVDWMDDFSSIKEQLEKHRNEISSMNPVVEVQYNGEDWVDLEKLILEQIPQLGGGKMIRKGLSFDFDQKGAHNIVLHARSAELRAAALAAPYVAKKGKLIAGQKNHENTNMTTLTYAAPVIIEGQPVNVGVAIQFTSDGRPRAVNVETESGGVFRIDKTAQGHRSRTGKSQVLQLLTRAVSDDTLSQNKETVKHKFAMREEVEETDKLVAVHNKSISGLRRMLRRGGVPFPSIAIKKAGTPHEGFGDVSIVFPRSTIDPQVNRQNRLYSNDAWTPTEPRTEYEVVDTWKLRQQMEEELGTDAFRATQLGSYLEENQLARDLETSEGDIVRALKGRTGIKYAYLKSIGQEPEAARKEKPLDGFGRYKNAQLLAVFETIPAAELKAMNYDSTETLQKVADVLHSSSWTRCRLTPRNVLQKGARSTPRIRSTRRSSKTPCGITKQAAV